MAASFRFGWPELNQLSKFTAPALVIHGTADLVLPVRHATALAGGIHGSDLELIDGMGHLPTRGEWDRISTLAVAHLSHAAHP
jgi:pimeloyl-ACP methyl ester carboxylesterase